MDLFTNAPEPLSTYYQILSAGIDSYGNGEQLLTLLADDLDFEGPISGRISGAVRFSHGIRGFLANVSRIEPIQLVATNFQAASLYDALLPGGAVRFSEFFTIDASLITALRIQYDSSDYIAKGGR